MTVRLVFSLALFLSGTLAVFLFAVSWRHRRRIAGAVDFCALIVGSICYAWGYIFELWGGDLATILIATRVEYLGLAFVPSLWLIFVLRYTGLAPSRLVRWSLLAYSLATWLVVLTIPLHGLFYVGPSLRPDSPFPVLTFGKGPWYWVQQAWLWLCILSGDVILILFLRRAPRAFRGQILLALIATVAPLGANAIYLAGRVPYGLDVGPLNFIFSFALLTLALFKFHFLDLMPVARERVMEALEDGVVVVDAEGRIVDSNPAARRVFGSDSLRAGRTFQAFCSEFEGLCPLLGAEARLSEFSLEVPGQGPRRFRARAFPVGGPKGRSLGTAFLVTDITEASALLARLDELASTDSLTGLMNRRRFFEIAQREMEVARRSGRPLSMAIADLDHFKDVNDSHGHAMGDIVLREAAARFLACLRSTDLVCRYGGEEFAFLFPNCDLEAGRRTAERLREGLASGPIVAGEVRVAVSASFGVSVAPPLTAESLDFILRLADEALYEAKESGRDRVCVKA